MYKLFKTDTGDEAHKISGDNPLVQYLHSHTFLNSTYPTLHRQNKKRMNILIDIEDVGDGL